MKHDLVELVVHMLWKLMVMRVLGLCGITWWYVGNQWGSEVKET